MCNHTQANPNLALKLPGGFYLERTFPKAGSVLIQVFLRVDLCDLCVSTVNNARQRLTTEYAEVAQRIQVGHCYSLISPQ